MESLVNYEQRGVAMYDGQSFMEEDIEWMEEHGFIVESKEDHSESSPPEIDIVFINTRFFQQDEPEPNSNSGVQTLPE